MSATALAGGLASLGGSIVSGLFGQNQASLSFSRQKELMALQNQYAVENWNRENAYNSPKAQMERLKAAGLNPNLVYGSGAAGVSGLGGSIDTPSAPSSPMAPTPDFSSAVGDAVSAAVGIAQAKKADKESIGKDIENRYNEQTLKERIAAVGKLNDKTDKEIAVLQEQIPILSQTYSKLVGEVNILSTERQIRDKELGQWDERFKKEMREFDDRHKLSKQEYIRLRDTYEDFKRMAKASADDKEWDVKLKNQLFDINEDWTDTEKSLGILGKFLNLLIKVVR